MLIFLCSFQYVKNDNQIESTWRYANPSQLPLCLRVSIIDNICKNGKFENDEFNRENRLSWKKT